MTPVRGFQTMGKLYKGNMEFTDDIPEVLSRMEEREITYLSNQRNGSGNSGSMVNVNILNGDVPFTPRNCAIFNGYSSPRQYALSASHMNRNGTASGTSVKKRKHTTDSKLASLSKSSFDYDADEEIRLEELKFYIAPKLKAYTTEEVYNLSCSVCGVVPSQTYVKQLRNSRRILLQNCSLSRQTVKPIAISFVRDHNIIQLDLTGNNIGPLGVMYIAEMLVENDTLYELNLSSTYPCNEGLQVLAECLSDNKSLRILRLESNDIDHRDSGAIVTLMKNAKHLTELYLGHNSLGYEGGKLLAKELETNTTLKVLDLQWNHFRRESAAHISNAMKLNTGLRKLNVSWNGWGKEGCIALAKSLPKNKTMTELDLGNNRIDTVCLPFLLHGLVRNDHLKCIKLGQNPMTTEGAKAVIKALTKAKDSQIVEVTLEDIPVDREFTDLVEDLQAVRTVSVVHGEEMYSAIEIERKEHDPNDLNRFDPVLVLVEYMRIDNLRLIDLFQFFDTHNRNRLSRSDFRDGVATLQLPLTEHHLDEIMTKIDLNRDGYIDIEEFMTAHREMSRQVTQRTTKAKSKGKVDLGLKELRQILKNLVEKRNQNNKEKAAKKMKENLIKAVQKVISDGRRRSAVFTSKTELLQLPGMQGERRGSARSTTSRGTSPPPAARLGSSCSSRPISVKNDSRSGSRKSARSSSTPPKSASSGWGVKRDITSRESISVSLYENE